MPVLLILAVAVIVVLALVLGVLITRQKDPQRRATVLTQTGLGLMAVFTVFAGAFIGGYAMDDSGGTAGLMMILSRAAPMLVLAALASFWPAGAAPLLLALTAVVIAVSVWFAFDPTTARSFQSSNGPVLAVGVVVLAFPAAVLGLKLTRTAGWLLLALAVLPLLVTVLGRSGPAASLATASVVPLVTGVIDLLAARLERRGSAAGTTRAARA